MPKTELFVGNLDRDVQRKEIEDVFELMIFDRSQTFLYQKINMHQSVPVYTVRLRKN